MEPQRIIFFCAKSLLNIFFKKKLIQLGGVMCNCASAQMKRYTKEIEIEQKKKEGKRSLLTTEDEGHLR